MAGANQKKSDRMPSKPALEFDLCHSGFQLPDPAHRMKFAKELEEELVSIAN